MYLKSRKSSNIQLSGKLFRIWIGAFTVEGFALASTGGGGAGGTIKTGPGIPATSNASSYSRKIAENSSLL